MVGVIVSPSLLQHSEQDDGRESRETIRVFVPRDDRCRRLPLGGASVSLHHPGHCARQRASDATAAIVHIGGQIGFAEPRTIAGFDPKDVF